MCAPHAWPWGKKAGAVLFGIRCPPRAWPWAAARAPSVPSRRCPPRARIACRTLRLAEEYDVAQDRGKVAKSGQRNDLVVGRNEVKPTAADLGLRRDEIHTAPAT